MRYALLFAITLCTSVITLTDSNFTEFLSNNHITLVKFYADWCSHCKLFRQEYIKVAELASPTLQVAELNAPNNPLTSNQQSIPGYPTVKLYIKGREPINYSGKRKAEDIISWAHTLSLNTITYIKDISEVHENNSAIWVNLENEGVAINYEKQFRTFAHYILNSTSYTGSHLLLINTSFSTFEDFALKTNDINKILKIRTLQPYNNYQDNLLPYMFTDMIPLMMLVGHFGVDTVTEMEKMMLNASTHYREFIYVRGFYKDYETGVLLSKLRIELKHTPCIVIINATLSDSGEPIYSIYMLRNVTAQRLDEFILNFQRNNLKKWYKSQDAIVYYESPFIGIAGINYHDVVTNKDNFLVVHETPLSRAASKTKRNLLKLKKLIPDMDLKIGFIDITKNEYEGMKEYYGFGIELYIRNSNISYTMNIDEHYDALSLYRFINEHIPSIAYNGYIYSGDPFKQEV